MLRKSSYLAIGLFAVLAAAQGPPARAPRPPALPPFEIHPDHSVTFQVRAPEATDVKLSGDFTKGAQALQKGENGVWTLTVGPLQPAIYAYSISIDGVSTIQPTNPFVQTGARSTGSLFEVPAEKPAAYDVRPVPHGTVHINWYESKALGVQRMMYSGTQKVARKDCGLKVPTNPSGVVSTALGMTALIEAQEDTKIQNAAKGRKLGESPYSSAGCGHGFNLASNGCCPVRFPA
jgi:hypothetical protein